MTLSPRRALLLLVLLPLAAGCSGQRSGSGPAPGPVSGSSTAGLLQGHLYGVGGPAAGGRQAWPGTVTVSGGGIRRDLAAGADGSYSATLPPGRYALRGRSPRFGDGTGTCTASTEVRITAGATSTVDTYCSMK